MRSRKLVLIPTFIVLVIGSWFYYEAFFFNTETSLIEVSEAPHIASAEDLIKYRNCTEEVFMFVHDLVYKLPTPLAAIDSEKLGINLSVCLAQGKIEKDELYPTRVKGKTICAGTLIDDLQLGKNNITRHHCENMGQEKDCTDEVTNNVSYMTLNGVHFITDDYDFLRNPGGLWVLLCGKCKQGSDVFFVTVDPGYANLSAILRSQILTENNC